MASGIHIVPRANCVVNTKNELVDLEPWMDIRDTPEDQELYPNDWMSVIFMTQKIYDGLLNRMKVDLQSTVAWMHPNKALWVTLRHFVIGDTVRPSEENAVVGACKSIWTTLEEEFLPEMDYPTMAAEFEANWGVHGCFGAIAATILRSEHLDLYYLNRDGVELHTHWTLGVDAKLNLILSTVFEGVEDTIFPEIMDQCNLGRIFNSNPPPYTLPKVPKDSKAKLPYTLVGDQRLGSRKWLRVATHGRDEENKEIERGLIPAKFTMNLLMSRFGILKLKHPLFLQDKTVVNCLPILHNYFMKNNPAYGDLKELLDEFKATVPEPVPPPPKQNEEVAQENVKKAMLRMKMDEKCVQILKDKTGISAHHLHEFLSFIGLGQIDEKEPMGLAMGVTLIPSIIGLKEYITSLPFPVQKWKEIAADFELKMQIPNCAGVIATRRVALCTAPDPREDCYAVLVMIIDPNYRVTHGELVIKHLSVAESVEKVLNKKKLNLHKHKELVLIGSEGLKKHRLLVRPGDTGHLTEAQVNRALMISEKLIDALVDRFAVMDNSVTQRTGSGAGCAQFVGSVLHNFLMDNSSIYAAGFKN